MGWDFPGGPVVQILPSIAWHADSIPGGEAKIPPASWPKQQNIKKKQYVTNSIKTLKNGPN